MCAQQSWPPAFCAAPAAAHADGCCRLCAALRGDTCAAVRGGACAALLLQFPADLNVEIVANAGHFPFIDQPEQFNQALIRSCQHALAGMLPATAAARFGLTKAAEQPMGLSPAAAAAVAAANAHVAAVEASETAADVMREELASAVES